ncbi:MAG: ferredoxin [Clostridiales bacterium]|nr:ferredoxin [Clostridiales bacterium]
MKFHVNANCIGCGLCESTCPEVFSINGDNMAVAVEGEVDPAVESTALEAKDNCPVSAIEEA